VLGLQVPANASAPVSEWPLLVSEPRSLLQRFLGRSEGTTWTVSPNRVVGSYASDLLSYPLVDVGLVNVVKRADRSFLWLAIGIFPLNYLITGFRWKLLLSMLEIPISAARATIGGNPCGPDRHATRTPCASSGCWRTIVSQT